MPHQARLLPIGVPFIELPTVDSTNNYAMAQIQKGVANHGTVYFAHNQTEGKGQRGKTWTTERGVNLILSVVLEPSPFKPDHSFYISAMIAQACYDFFKNYAGHETSIKWPNDIYWRDRKAGGILIENIFRGDHLTYSIAGIGININQTKYAESLLNPVSLRQITGKIYSPVHLAKGLCSSLDFYYQKLELERNEILENYNRSLYKRNELVKLRKKNVVFETRIIGVNPTGKLLTVDKIYREFDFGEVQWVV